MNEKKPIDLKVNKNATGGFTIIELMLAISILAIIAAPLMMSFSVATKTVVTSGEMTKANFLAQMAIEEIASRSIKQLDELANTATPGEIPYIPASPTVSPTAFPTATPYGIEISYKVSKASGYVMDNGYFGVGQTSAPTPTPLPYAMFFSVNDTNVDINNNSYELPNDKEYLMVIKRAAADSYNAEIYQCTPTGALPIATPMPVASTAFSSSAGDDIRIKLLNDNLTDEFKFNVNIDDVNEPPNDSKKVEFHIANNTSGLIGIKNDGEDYFSQINLMNEYNDDPFTNVYKIEVIVKIYDYGGAVPLSNNSFVSYVKK